MLRLGFVLVVQRLNHFHQRKILSCEDDAHDLLQELFQPWTSIARRPRILTSTIESLRSRAFLFWLGQTVSFQDEFSMAMQRTVIDALTTYVGLTDHWKVLLQWTKQLFLLYLKEDCPNPLPTVVSSAFRALGPAISFVTTIEKPSTQELLRASFFALFVRALLKSALLEDPDVHTTLTSMVRTLYESVKCNSEARAILRHHLDETPPSVAQNIAHRTVERLVKLSNIHSTLWGYEQTLEILQSASYLTYFMVQLGTAQVRRGPFFRAFLQHNSLLWVCGLLRVAILPAISDLSSLGRPTDYWEFVSKEALVTLTISFQYICMALHRRQWILVAVRADLLSSLLKTDEFLVRYSLQSQFDSTFLVAALGQLSRNVVSSKIFRVVQNRLRRMPALPSHPQIRGLWEQLRQSVDAVDPYMHAMHVAPVRVSCEDILVWTLCYQIRLLSHPPVVCVDRSTVRQ